jgi:hypothetical protein
MRAFAASRGRVIASFPLGLLLAGGCTITLPDEFSELVVSVAASRMASSEPGLTLAAVASAYRYKFGECPESETQLEQRFTKSAELPENDMMLALEELRKLFGRFEQINFSDAPPHRCVINFRQKHRILDNLADSKESVSGQQPVAHVMPLQGTIELDPWIEEESANRARFAMELSSPSAGGDEESAEQEVPSIFIPGPFEGSIEVDSTLGEVTMRTRGVGDVESEKWRVANEIMGWADGEDSDAWLQLMLGLLSPPPSDRHH